MGLKLMRRWLMRHAEVRGAQSRVSVRFRFFAARAVFLPRQGLTPCWPHPSYPCTEPHARSLAHPPCAAAQGDVLEVSAGTGRNLAYYPLARLRSLTLTDTSRGMLVNAADKWAALAAKRGDQAPPVRFELADAQRLTASAHSQHDGSSKSSSAVESSSEAAEAPGTPRQGAEVAPTSAPHRPQLREPCTFPPASFDVVVDTFGLCSQQDPVTALKVGGVDAGSSQGCPRVGGSEEPACC